LPDGLFSNQKSKFGKIFEGLAIEDDGIFYGHFTLTVFCYILWTIGKVHGNLLYISFPVLVFFTKKNLATLLYNTFVEAACLEKGRFFQLISTLFCTYL
jgi:hypothetical protein